MSSSRRRSIELLIVVVFAVHAAAQTPSVDALAGLWKSKKRFGPDARGTLIVERVGDAYTAEMVGRVLPMRIENGELTFDLPDRQGTFRGKLEAGIIRGHWFRPPAPANMGVYVSGVSLEADGPNRWRGTVVPFEDYFTFFLLAQKKADGTMGVVLRNPERDIGGQYGVNRITLDGNVAKLFGKRGGKELVVASGTYDAENESLTLSFPNRGGSYDFVRDGDESDFYPRGKNPRRYQYRPPPTDADGWRTTTLDDANISRAWMESFVRKVSETPMDSPDALQLHAILIARHGKLVLEEYFHGEHRDRLHDSRSASKSLTSIVVGAAIEGGAPLALSSPVYQVMNGGAFAAGVEAQKKAMTLEHLLTMSGGYFCDDTNDEAPGNEDKMIDQTEEPDYYRYTMRVPLATLPGENSVYCSAMPNLALGMVGRATREHPIYTFDRLVAGPMKIKRYGWPLDPAGNPSGGGSVQLLPRDFLKLGQLMLNGGTWDGHRILSRDFVARATSPQYRLRNIGYGYLWWTEDYPYKNRTVRSFSARGAGGQMVTVIPELDLVVASHGANYRGNRATLAAHNALVPRFILPAVREAGDDPNAPVAEREFTSPYGPSKDGRRIAPPR